MKHLLDVNTLIALAHTGHTLHRKTVLWFSGLSAATDELWTCSITELGFVRVAVMVGLQPDVASAKQSLKELKASSRVPFGFIPDDLGAADLPAFVKNPGAITDGHLSELARTKSMSLVTLDRGIPGAEYIG